MSLTTSNVSFPTAIKTAIAHYINSNLNTCLPGKITRVIDYKKRKVSVQPTIRRVYLDEEVLEPPVIDNVTLQYTGTEDAIIKFPIKVGQNVLLIFSQRSLDNWLLSGDVSLPGSKRKFDISDAIAIPSLQTFNTDHPLIDNNEDTEIVTKDNKIVIKANGTIEIGGDNLKKLVTEEFQNVFDTHVHNFIAAPSGTYATSPPASQTTTLYPPPTTIPTLALFGSKLGNNELTDKTKAE